MFIGSGRICIGGCGTCDTGICTESVLEPLKSAQVVLGCVTLESAQVLGHLESVQVALGHLKICTGGCGICTGGCEYAQVGHLESAQVLGHLKSAQGTSGIGTDSRTSGIGTGSRTSGICTGAIGRSDRLDTRPMTDVLVSCRAFSSKGRFSAGT
ncbi:hypothetical protein TNCV_3887041 [Trichonephila clavipes]|nr:hypothetical protein TNCV_3887041 [Trichonephila clavipes]